MRGRIILYSRYIVSLCRLIQTQRNTLIVFFVWWLLIGCRDSTIVNNMAQSDAATTAELSIAGSSPTPTVDIELTDSPHVVATTVELNSSKHPWQDKCGEQRSIKPGEISLPAKILGYLAGESLRLIEQDLTIRELDLENDTYHEYVSPDGKWLSYFSDAASNGASERSTRLVFTSFEDDSHYVIPWRPNWTVPALDPWFSPDYVRLREENQDGSHHEVLLSPFGQQIALHWEKLPNIYPYDLYLNAKVNPTLSYVLYQSSVTEDAPLGHTILWDLRSEEIVWQSDPDFIVDFSSTIWARDGSIVAFSAHPIDENSELYTLSISGQLQKRTDFSEHFGDFVLASFIWSPNGEWLLFAFGDREHATGALPFRPLVLDISTQTVFNFCITAYSNFHTFQPWSPDNSMLAFVGTVNSTGERLLIVELETGDILFPPVSICVPPECEPPGGQQITGVLGWLRP